MDKPAETQYPIHDIFRQRWSPRAFAEHLVEPEQLMCLLEAARWAPSCFNEQPWSFILATKNDEAEYAKLLSCLVEGNQAWACQAPVLSVTVAKGAFDHNGQPNKHAWHDVGLAVGNLVMQATVLGLAVHQMAGILPDRVRELYGVPDGFDPVSALAIGYAGDPSTLPDSLREKELSKRSRRALQEFVFVGNWGQVATQLSKA